MPPKVNNVSDETCKYRHGSLVKVIGTAMAIIVTAIFFLLNSDSKLEASIIPIASGNAAIEQKIINVDNNVKEIKQELKEIKQEIMKCVGKISAK